MMKYLLAIVLLLTSFLPVAEASHLMGGELTYRQIDSNRTVVYMTLYRDSRGIPVSGMQTYTAATTTITTVRQMSLVQMDTVSPVCAPFHVERFVFGDTLTHAPGDTLQISSSFCCRNFAITNLQAPMNQNMYIATAKYPAPLVAGTINSSPVMNAYGRFFVPAGNTYTLDFSAADPDGDSLVYRLGVPAGVNNTPLPYLHGAGMPVDGSFQLDSLTGSATVNANYPQVAVIRVDIDEYRVTPQGTYKIGTTYRDVQVHFIGGINNLPEMTGIDSTQQFAVQVTAGDTVHFSVYATDVDTADSLSWHWLPDIPGATLTVTSGPRPVLTFDWPTTAADVRFAPHQQLLRVLDDYCIASGEDSRTFSIVVLPDTADVVWPGDTDDDLVANVLDVLPIGLAYGAQGPARINATTNWVGQSGLPWNDTFWNGLDYKFADANGDGTIDSADVDVVYLNYGQTHQKQGAQAGEDIRIYVSGNEVISGGQAELVIEMAQPLPDIYGVAMELQLPAGLMDVAPASKQAGGLLGIDELLTAELIGADVLAFAITATDQQVHGGSGELARLAFTVGNNLMGGDSLTIGIPLLSAINAQGSRLPVGVDAEPFQVTNPQTAVTTNAADIRLYPNPTADVFTIRANKDMAQVRLYDIMGRLMATYDGSRQPFVLPSGIAPGFYPVVVQGVHNELWVQQLMVK